MLINMKKELISKELLKITKSLIAKQLDNKLYNTKNKQTAKNIIYRNIENLTKGIFRDQNWSNVRRIWDRLKQLGLDVNVEVKNGGYFNDRYTGQIAGKKYYFDFEFSNIEGKLFRFEGELICSFCGTVEDPMSAYDISFIIY